MNPPNLIGISGQAGSGKDTTAKILQELLDTKGSYWMIERFSAKLKDVCSTLCGVYPSQFESAEGKNRFYPEWNMTGRQILQKVGSLLRDEFDKDVWIKLLFEDLPLHANLEWIICDLRYKNEFEAIKQRGGLCIRVDRPGLPEDPHQSEQEWRGFEFDWVIDNSGSLDDLRKKVQLFIANFSFD